MGCDIGYGYLHRIPTYDDSPKRIKKEAVPLLLKQNISAPGFTGIPQVDQISHGASKQFPSPNQFAVSNISTGTSFYQPPISSTAILDSNIACSNQQSSLSRNEASTLVSTYQSSTSSNVNGISAPLSSSVINLPPPPPIISSSVLGLTSNSLINEVISL